MWLFCAFLSLLFTALNLFFTVKKQKAAQWASLCALSFTAITVLLEYRLAADWVCREDWAALLDVVPFMNSALTGYVVILIGANVLMMLLQNKKGSAA